MSTAIAPDVLELADGYDQPACLMAPPYGYFSKGQRPGVRQRSQTSSRVLRSQTLSCSSGSPWPHCSGGFKDEKSKKRALPRYLAQFDTRHRERVLELLAQFVAAGRTQRSTEGGQRVLWFKAARTLLGPISNSARLAISLARIHGTDGAEDARALRLVRDVALSSVRAATRRGKSVATRTNPVLAFRQPDRRRAARVGPRDDNPTRSRRRRDGAAGGPCRTRTRGPDAPWDSTLPPTRTSCLCSRLRDTRPPDLYVPVPALAAHHERHVRGVPSRPRPVTAIDLWPAGRKPSRAALSPPENRSAADRGPARPGVSARTSGSRRAHAPRLAPAWTPDAAGPLGVPRRDRDTAS